MKDQKVTVVVTLCNGDVSVLKGVVLQDVLMEVYTQFSAVWSLTIIPHIAVKIEDVERVMEMQERQTGGDHE